MWNSILIRFSLTLLLLWLVLTGPWWLALLIFLAGVWRLPHFYEALFPAFIFDLIYGVPALSWFGFQFLATVLALVWVAGFDELRGQIMM